MSNDTSESPIIAGVDGGGTKTDVAIARLDAKGQFTLIDSRTLGPGNIQSVPPAQVGAMCHAAIVEMMSHFQATVANPAAICFAMAGAGSDAASQELALWSKQHNIAKHIMVTHDARSLIAAGTPNDCGIALIAGTGSFAYARTANGNEDRCGGWGFLFGDEGSAYHLAIEGLKAACKSYDGRCPQTELFSAITHWLHGALPGEWYWLLKDASRDRIASLAQIISDLAESGDTTACALLEKSAQSLADLIATLAIRQFKNQTCHLALTGGFVLQSERLRTLMLAELSGRQVSLGEICLVSKPVSGALRMASGLWKQSVATRGI